MPLFFFALGCNRERNNTQAIFLLSVSDLRAKICEQKYPFLSIETTLKVWLVSLMPDSGTPHNSRVPKRKKKNNPPHAIKFC